MFERVQALAAVGMDLVVLGREAEAQVSLEETVRVSRRWGLKGSLAPALFYLGWLHARAGREHEAARCLGEAMRIAEEHDHVHFFSQEAKVAVPILALCDRFGAGSFVREQDRSAPARASAGTTSTSWPREGPIPPTCPWGRRGDAEPAARDRSAA